MQIFGLSDIGHVRKTNQDCFGFMPLREGHIAVVCDGMGGANAGNYASETVLSAVLRCAKERFSGELDLEQAKSVLRNCLRAVNKQLFLEAAADELLFGMGTTVVLMLTDEKDALFLNVGDSRGYLFREGALKKMTEDHSMVEEMVKKGHITEEEARVHPNRNIITMAIGPEEEILPNHYRISLLPGDVLLLCSDGLNSMLTDEEIAAVLRTTDPKDLPKVLISEAKARGGSDNITVVAAQA